MQPNVISFHYTVKTKSGAVLESSTEGDPVTYLEGSGRIIPGLENALKGARPGEKKSVALSPSEAYGEYDKELIVDMDRSNFPPGESICVGDQFRIRDDDDSTRVFTVREIAPAQIKMDGNHPLAGQELFFDIQVMGIRPATQADIEADEHAAEGCEGHDHTHDHGPKH